MSMDIQPDDGYKQQDFVDVLRHIQQSRQKIFAQINTALIDLYWQIGQIISHKISTAAWGKGVVTDLAAFIAQHDPELKGFSDKNLWRMKQFFETYQADEKLSPLVRALPWTHNTIIFSRCKSADEREYYLNLCIKERYSKRELERQICLVTRGAARLDGIPTRRVGTSRRHLCIKTSTLVWERGKIPIGLSPTDR